MAEEVLTFFFVKELMDDLHFSIVVFFASGEGVGGGIGLGGGVHGWGGGGVGVVVWCGGGSCDFYLCEEGCNRGASFLDVRFLHIWRWRWSRW